MPEVAGCGALAQAMSSPHQITQPGMQVQDGASPNPGSTPDTDIQENGWTLLNGHGAKEVMSCEKQPSGHAEPGNDQAHAEEALDQDRAESSAEPTSEQPVKPELANGHHLVTPRRLTPRSPASGEAPGPTTPMQPPNSNRCTEISPLGRSGDEQTQPEESAAVKPAGSPWRGAGKDQRPVQKRGSPNGRQNAARALFEGRPKNGLWSSQSGAYHRANPMNAEEQWLNQPVMTQEQYTWTQAQSFQCNGNSHDYSQEYCGPQDVVWSGNTGPYHIPGPAPPREPYPGSPPQQMCFEQRTPPRGGAQYGYPFLRAQYNQDGQQFMAYQPAMNRYAGASHTQKRHALPQQGPRYQQGLSEDEQRLLAARQAEYQRQGMSMEMADHHAHCELFALQHQQHLMHAAMMGHSGYVQFPSGMVFSHPSIAPVSIPSAVHQYTGTLREQGGSSARTQQGRGGGRGGGCAPRGGPSHRRSCSLPEDLWPDAGRVAPAPRHRRQVSLPNVDIAPRASVKPAQSAEKPTTPAQPVSTDAARPPRHGHRRQSSDILPGGFNDRPSCAACARLARQKGHRRQHSSPAEVSGFRGGAEKGGRGNKGRGQGGRPGSPGGSGDGKRPSADSNEPHDPDWPHSGLTLQEVLQDLIMYCCEQFASKQVQAIIIKRVPPQEVNAFAAGFMAHPDMLAVTKDTFGNYVTQCILVHADNDHRLALARLLMPHMLELAQHEYGTRVLQSAIENLSSIKEKVELALQLRGHVVECMRDRSGNHLIQKCLTHIPTAEDGHSIDFMLEELRDAPATMPEELTTLPPGQKPLEDAGWIGISMHTYGCRIMQRIMESCELPGWKEPICREVVEHARQLAWSDSGNYVIQCILKSCSEEDRETAFIDLFADVGGLSFDKHGSHVVEKVIWNKDTKRPATRAQLDALWARLFTDTGNKNEPGPLLDRLIPHEYGNYVVSSCLEAMSESQRRTIRSHIEAELRAMEANPKADGRAHDRIRKLLNKVNAILPQQAEVGVPS